MAFAHEKPCHDHYLLLGTRQEGGKSMFGALMSEVVSPKSQSGMGSKFCYHWFKGPFEANLSLAQE